MMACDNWSKTEGERTEVDVTQGIVHTTRKNRDGETWKHAEKNITNIMLLAILMGDIHKMIPVIINHTGKPNVVSSVQIL